jgi:LuxR family maltose regulon positive regulatory protein
VVARPRLSQRLSRGGESALTLVSAPAGFGKTTLLTEWLAATPADGRSVAWLSLDQRDNDPALFWTYVVAAIQAAEPGVGGGVLSLLQSSQSPTEAVLATLLNDLHAVVNDLVLVLDHYHVIEASEVQEGMAFLLEHLPPQVHLVIASRADPALPLARLRARGELVEVRAADLRFTPDEVAAYLTEAMGLVLTAPEVAALEGRTEGWIAALQLAALSMQGRDDVSGFIAGFAGDDRHIVDYLAEEVLQRQPTHVRSFLLRTSILGRLSGSLCDAVTGQDGGKAMLEGLDRGNLFLVPLDDRRRWYRYHHLFADVLQAHLLDEQGDRVRELHLRASDWYERNGERSEAIHHALTAADFERAADLVELALPALRRGRQEATLRRWLEALPDELYRVRPVLTVGYVGSLMIRGDLEGVEELLRDAERWLDPTAAEGPRGSTGEMVVVDDEGFRALPSSIAMYRAGTALVLGDVAGTMMHARRALDLAGEDDHLGRGGPAALLGLAYWATGDLHAASRWYADARPVSRAPGTTPTQNRYRWRVAMARIREADGDLGGALDLLDEAERLYLGDFSPDVRPVPALRARVLLAQGRWGEALEWARERGLSVEDDPSYLREFEHITLARALLARYTAERDERSIDEVGGLLERLGQAAEEGARTGCLIDVLVVQALASQARGDVPAALASMRRALTLAEPEGYVRVFVDEGPPMALLLRALSAPGSAGSYVRHLLAAVDGTERGTPVSDGLIDPLSARELDVLRLLGTDLGGPDIARELSVSLNTVRTHTKNIYAKLGVNNRRAAVRRAEELDLMSRPGDRRTRNAVVRDR